MTTGHRRTCQCTALAYGSGYSLNREEVRGNLAPLCGRTAPAAPTPGSELSAVLWCHSFHGVLHRLQHWDLLLRHDTDVDDLVD